MELVFGVVELLERVLGEAFVFIVVGQRDGGYALMPVPTVDQFVEFGQSVFEVVETAHALHRSLPLLNGNFEGHGSIAAAIKACLLYTSPSPRDQRGSRMPSSA